jgi:hypothetical protein
MAALVVVDVAGPVEADASGTRLDIFPGGATPSVFQAGMSFWIGYGFASEAGSVEVGGVSEGTHFELDVDGRRVALASDVRREGDVVVRRTERAGFEAGLPAGWHTFHGRWYDGGRLLLSSRVSVEFVER